MPQTCYTADQQKNDLYCVEWDVKPYSAQLNQQKKKKARL